MSRNGPPKRMLSANTSTVEEDDQSDDDNSEDGEEEASKDTDEIARENISPPDQLSRIVPEAVPVAVKAPRRKQTKRRVIRKQPISA